MFANLLNNAIKHSTGPLKINIAQKLIENDHSKYYQTIIEDNGPGIPDALKPAIFDRAYRSKMRSGYSGLGLCLVKKLVDNYHGSIVLEDRVPGDRKQGSRFIVALPAAP